MSTSNISLANLTTSVKREVQSSKLPSYTTNHMQNNTCLQLCVFMCLYNCRFVSVWDYFFECLMVFLSVRELILSLVQFMIRAANLLYCVLVLSGRTPILKHFYIVHVSVIVIVVVFDCQKYQSYLPRSGVNAFQLQCSTYYKANLQPKYVRNINEMRNQTKNCGYYYKILESIG